jgi:hypothetical protein
VTQKAVKAEIINHTQNDEEQPVATKKLETGKKKKCEIF